MKIYKRVEKYTALFKPEIDFLTNIVEIAPEGNVVVAGTYKGGDVMAMMLQDPTREYNVIDSFQGLADPEEEDIVHEVNNTDSTMIAGEFSCGGHESYLENFKEAKIIAPNTYPMFITEKSIKEVKPNKIAVLWLDLDHYKPTKVCLKYFDQFLVSGAIIGCHDYDFVRCPGIKQACDDYSNKWVHGAGGIYYMEK